MAHLAAHMQDQEDSSKLLDNMWQKQQQKAFTAWVNSHLRKAHPPSQIADIQTDLGDGRLLMKLCEIIGNTELGAPAKGNLKIHKIQNINKAFTYIKEKGVKLIGIAAEEIVDGNLKMILGMIWTLILRFEIQDISLEAMSAKDALLLWCQRKTEGYKNVRIQDFHMSWKDGLGFCALIHKHRPDLIDYDKLRKDQPAENLKYAFEVADKYLDIPPMLDVEDIVSCVKPDERSIMTYVVAYYKCFASSNKAEVAAKKIATVLETNRQHEKLIQEYEEMVSNLLEWIRQVIARLEERPVLETVTACQARFEEWNSFRANDYPPKLAEKGELEAHYSKLQTKLRLSGRPAYVPSEGKLISDVNSAWANLDSAEVANKDWILSELRRNQLAELKARRFNSKATAHEAWTADKDTLLQAQDYAGVNLGGVVALKKKHEGFQSDLAAHEAWVSEIGTLAEELNNLRYFDLNAINERYAAIYSNWEQLVTLSQQRQAALDEAEQKALKIDQLYLEFALHAPTFVNWLDAARSQLTDAYLAETEADVQALQQSHEQFKAELPQHQADFEKLAALQTEIVSLGGAENPYSTHSYDTITAGFQDVQNLIPARDNTFAAESSKQSTREQLRKDWAVAASDTNNWISSKLETVKKEVEGAAFEKLEDEVANLNSVEGECTAYLPKIEFLEKLHQQIQDSLIFENPHSTLSIENIRGSWQHLAGFIRRNATELQNQILYRDSRHMTEEQLRDLRESFKHFDKDGSNKLDRLEFRACLISLGRDIPQVPTPGNDAEFERILARVDPNNDGFVSYDEYFAFMSEESADAETSQQLVEAFKVIAAGHDYVTADQLRKDLDSALAEYCIQNMSPYQGGPPGALDFKSFASALYGETDL